jgi:hypothetical protein
MFKVPSQCPTCQSRLTIRELGCQSCGTTIRGTWAATPFASLSEDQEAFLVLFVRSRGNLSEVERALGVSYPTVRAKLEEVIQALSEERMAEAEQPSPAAGSRREVLERVSRGDLSAVEALEELRGRPADGES